MAMMAATSMAVGIGAVAVTVMIAGCVALYLFARKRD